MKEKTDKTCLPLSTFGASHDQSRVLEIALSILSAVNIRAPALELAVIRANGGVYGHSIGALWLLGSTVTLYLATFGISVRFHMRVNIHA